MRSCLNTSAGGRQQHFRGLGNHDGSPRCSASVQRVKLPSNLCISNSITVMGKSAGSKSRRRRNTKARVEAEAVERQGRSISPSSSLSADFLNGQKKLARDESNEKQRVSRPYIPILTRVTKSKRVISQRETSPSIKPPSDDRPLSQPPPLFQTTSEPQPVQPSFPLPSPHTAVSHTGSENWHEAALTSNFRAPRPLTCSHDFACALGGCPYGVWEGPAPEYDTDGQVVDDEYLTDDQGRIIKSCKGYSAHNPRSLHLPSHKRTMQASNSGSGVGSVSGSICSSQKTNMGRHVLINTTMRLSIN